jgi:hypothetical protein
MQHHFSLPSWHGARGTEGKYSQEEIILPRFDHYTRSGLPH